MEVGERVGTGIYTEGRGAGFADEMTGYEMSGR